MILKTKAFILAKNCFNWPQQGLRRPGGRDTVNYNMYVGKINVLIGQGLTWGGQEDVILSIKASILAKEILQLATARPGEARRTCYL